MDKKQGLLIKTEDKVITAALASQRNEITEHFIYLKLSEIEKEPGNSEVLKKIAADERRHYEMWRAYTGREVAPSALKMRFYTALCRVLGLTFCVKLMEGGEKNAQVSYGVFPDSARVNTGSIAADEERHERELIALIDEDMLKYVSSIVLGLNDALVELIGALSGFSLALHDNRLVLTAGLVTGIAGSLSMAASQYLSVKSEAGDKHPVKSAVYTGIAFMLAAVSLVMPYFVFRDVFVSLGAAVFNAIFILFIFSYYISVTKEVPFLKRFAEMAAISIGVAAVTFGFTELVGRLLHLRL